MVSNATRGCRSCVSSPSIPAACLMRVSSPTRRSIIITNNHHHNNINHHHHKNNNNDNHATFGAVSSVTIMFAMFDHAYAFNQDISAWDGK